MLQVGSGALSLPAWASQTGFVAEVDLCSQPSVSVLPIRTDLSLWVKILASTAAFSTCLRCLRLLRTCWVDVVLDSEREECLCVSDKDNPAYQLAGCPLSNTKLAGLLKGNNKQTLDIKAVVCL